MLSSERLVLRAVEPKDVEFLFDEENNIDIWHLSNTITPFSKQVLTDYANSTHDLITHKQFRFIIEIKKSNKIIGMLDLFDFDLINSRAGVGILISDLSERNKGYASEAIVRLKDYALSILYLNQLYCSIHASNQESIALFSKLGFKQMGVRRNWLRTGQDSWEDEVEFQLLLK